jgi:hypothetical protein
VALEEVKRRTAVYFGLRESDNSPSKGQRAEQYVILAVLLAIFYALERIIWWPWAFLAVMALAVVLGRLQASIRRCKDRSAPTDSAT